MAARVTALVLGLWLAATPVFGVFCEMDCDGTPATIACHDATGLPPGPALRSAHHACDHDHTTGTPALLTGISPRDAVGPSALGPVAILAHASISDARAAIAALPEPLSDRRSRTSSCAPILRI